MKLKVTLVLSFASLFVFLSDVLAKPIPVECRSFETPLGIDVGKASHILRTGEWRERSRAVRCIVFSSSGADSLLLEVLKDPDPRVRRTLLFTYGENLTRSDLYLAFLKDSDTLVRTVAVEFAYLSGPAAAQPLARIAKDSAAPIEQRILALQSIERLGDEAIEVRSSIAGLLGSDNSTIRIASLRALAAMGVGASDVVPQVEARMNKVSADSLEGRWAKETVARLRPERIVVE